MSFVQLSGVSLAFGNRDILRDVSMRISAGTKAALTGANGCGKSTLMKIMAGLDSSDAGTVSTGKNVHVAYLPQYGIVHQGKTLFEEVETAFARFEAMERRLEIISEKLAVCREGSRRIVLQDEFNTTQTELELSPWYHRRAIITEVLTGLSFTRKDSTRPVEEFSGGWQMRIALAKVLLQQADILILDEPTNYLDIEARNWLEQYLKSFKGGFILVSHDRFFLDYCVSETYELFNGCLRRYTGSYTEYEKTRQVELASLLKSYEEQKAEIKKTEDFIRKFRYNASKAALVQDRIKRLGKITRIEIPEHLKKISVRFPPAPHSGKIVIDAKNIQKAYSKNVVLDSIDLLIEQGERIVLAGKNGAGKSSLLKILSGSDSDFSGSVHIGTGVRMGYFSQDAGDIIVGEQSILSLVESRAPTDMIPKCFDLLAAFLFRGDDVYKPLSVLSGGEKSRLAMLLLLLQPLNLLILDEPTNHLDLHSKDALLDALRNFSGTIIVVSHDKIFMQGLATRVVELSRPSDIEPAVLKNFPGDYDYYVYQRDRGSPPVPSKQETAPTVQKSKGAVLYEEQKKARSSLRKKKKEEQRLLNEIEKTEQEITACTESLADAAIYTDGKKSRSVKQAITALEMQLEHLTDQWEKVLQELEEC